MPKILIDVIPARSLVPEPQTAEQLVEVPTVRSRSSALQFLLVVASGVFKVFPRDRLQQRRVLVRNAFLSGLWSRSLVSLFLVEAFPAASSSLPVVLMAGLELKVLPVSWYDGLARTLTKVQDTGVWPDGLLDANIAMIPKTDSDAAPLGQRPLSVLPVIYRWLKLKQSFCVVSQLILER